VLQGKLQRWGLAPTNDIDGCDFGYVDVRSPAPNKRSPLDKEILEEEGFDELDSVLV
jgi:hypothetical protein